MLGEALPDVAPDIHALAVSRFNFGHAWMKPRDEWLAAAGIAMTNVLNFQPYGNKIESLCVQKKELPVWYDLPAISHGKYLRPEFLSEVERLAVELAEARPNLVVACGNTACWAILRATNISQIRGAMATSDLEGLDPPLKVLPTYHPAGVLYNWAWRPIMLTDLMKAMREAEFPEVRRPERQVIVNPTLDELAEWTNQTLVRKPPLLACDIETSHSQITCIGFARSRTEAIVVPFWNQASPGWHYWPTAEAEREAWSHVEGLLASRLPKVFQNGLYDLQYLIRMGLCIRQCDEDTMLLHHALFPEMQKGLGFLGSIYTNEPAWKLMRRKRADTEKKDE